MILTMTERTFFLIYACGSQLQTWACVHLTSPDCPMTYVLCHELSCRQPSASGFYCQLSLASRPLYKYAWHALLCVFQLIVLTLLFVAAVLGLFVTGHVSAPCAQFDNSGRACLQGTRLCAKPLRQVCRRVKPSVLRASTRVKAWQ